jgi:hypothetical protein
MEWEILDETNYKNMKDKTGSNDIPGFSRHGKSQKDKEKEKVREIKEEKISKKEEKQREKEKQKEKVGKEMTKSPKKEKKLSSLEDQKFIEIILYIYIIFNDRKLVLKSNVLPPIPPFGPKHLSPPSDPQSVGSNVVLVGGLSNCLSSFCGNSNSSSIQPQHSGNILGRPTPIILSKESSSAEERVLSPPISPREVVISLEPSQNSVSNTSPTVHYRFYQSSSAFPLSYPLNSWEVQNGDGHQEQKPQLEKSAKSENSPEMRGILSFFLKSYV